jgi:hypothetical protein
MYNKIIVLEANFWEYMRSELDHQMKLHQAECTDYLHIFPKKDMFQTSSKFSMLSAMAAASAY